MSREVIAVKHKNVLGSGINMTIVHNPMIDGPLDMYKKSKDCEVITLKIEE